MLAKQILYFRHELILICDARCDKAWGRNRRPTVQLSATDENDFAYLADDELGKAPADPGTSEGGHRKPRTPEDRLNKWCCRECERSVKIEPGEDFELPDFGHRLYNIPRDGANGKAV